MSNIPTCRLITNSQIDFNHKWWLFHRNKAQYAFQLVSMLLIRIAQTDM